MPSSWDGVESSIASCRTMEWQTMTGAEASGTQAYAVREEESTVGTCKLEGYTTVTPLPVIFTTPKNYQP